MKKRDFEKRLLVIKALGVKPFGTGQQPEVAECTANPVTTIGQDGNTICHNRQTIEEVISNG